MSVLVSLHHVTRYLYDRPVALGPQMIRLRPAPHGRTRIPSYSLKVIPAEHHVNWQHDPHGNWVARYTFAQRTTEFTVTVDLHADLVAVNPFDFFVEPYAATYPFALPPDLAHELGGYLDLEPLGAQLRAFLSEVPKGPIGTVQFLTDLNALVQRGIRYVVRMEAGVQTPEETLEAGAGSCRDSSWLLVQALRHLGLPARFVSGYLIQLKPDVVPLDGPPGPSQDGADFHAWAEVFIPGAGWIGLDPTSGLLTGEGHIPLAATPHHRSAAPITGTADPGETKFFFEMSVARVSETPRVTRPFSDEAWATLDALGEQVDADLAAQDVRLTMGGEPTFVSIDDYESAEWNIAAVGPTKRLRADELIRRLRDRFAPGGLLHYGQGKWYPGEPLPRWAFALYWRGEGLPVWRHVDLIATEAGGRPPPAGAARRFTEGLARRLGIAAEYVVPAFEDSVGRMRKGEPETTGPADPGDRRARARMVQTDEHRLAEPAGFVLPVRRATAYPRWVSELWKFHRGGLFLMPGDSPIGFRLPLDSLPPVPPDADLHTVPADPFASRDELPDPAVLAESFAPQREGAAPSLVPDAAPNGTPESCKVFVRTAVAVELRAGRLCVFMPPVDDLADYLAFLAAVEATAVELAVPVHVEGYGPPSDPRINVIKVTPDPGVIEVNVHPATSWRDAVAITSGLYEDARLCRLRPPHKKIDGRHGGTGGGNHVVLGGASAADSPFLRRPDLLKSLVLYWQRRPSLSDFFSGLFVGPTRQAPRIDEARQDLLYELEIALAQVPAPRKGAPPPPWLVDRLFRNLLADVTGNTHRTEICIDKLFSPDGPTGRLGLVEFRAFEMPPDARMSLAQQLLLRALVAWLWRNPLDGAPVRWGTALHDRYMLEHFVWQDFLEVLDDLRREGYRFDPTWFAAQREFRFPLYGAVDRAGVRLEVRHALEPWYVLGEEGTVGGTVRFVDSSVERLQVKVEGMTDGRHIVTCNERRI